MDKQVHLKSEDLWLTQQNSALALHYIRKKLVRGLLCLTVYVDVTNLLLVTVFICSFYISHYCSDPLTHYAAHHPFCYLVGISHCTPYIYCSKHN